MHLFSRRIVKFLISGVTAAVVEYGIFLGLLYLARTNLVAAQTASFLAGFVISFLLNKTWVFNSRGNVMLELPKYIVLALINILLSNFVLWFLVETVHVENWLAKFIVMGAVATWNYVIFQKIIFSNQSAKD